MIIYEIWVCSNITYGFRRHSSYLNRAAAELMAEVLRASDEFQSVWIEEKWDPEVD